MMDNDIYRICKILCPRCLNEWNEEIELIGENTGTAIVHCDNCNSFVDGIILKKEN